MNKAWKILLTSIASLIIGLLTISGCALLTIITMKVWKVIIIVLIGIFGYGVIKAYQICKEERRMRKGE